MKSRSGGTMATNEAAITGFHSGRAARLAVQEEKKGATGPDWQARGTI